MVQLDCFDCRIPEHRNSRSPCTGCTGARSTDHTRAQFDDREVVYSENGAFATTSAKLGDVYPSTYRTPKSRTMLSKVVAGFRRTMLQRQSLSPFFSARRGNSARIAPCLSCGIRSRPAPRTSTVTPEWVIATSGSL